MDWYVVDKKYINYLTQFDSHVGYVEYGERLKLHVGILLTIGDFHYYVPISSAKPKHQKMSNSLDFHKLQDESTGYLYAVLNINNMIPVPDNYLTQLKYNQVESFRSFSNEKEKTDYVYLLQKEKALIDNVQDTLQNKALKLYQKCIAKPDFSLSILIFPAGSCLTYTLSIIQRRTLCPPWAIRSSSVSFISCRSYHPARQV